MYPKESPRIFQMCVSGGEKVKEIGLESVYVAALWVVDLLWYAISCSICIPFFAWHTFRFGPTPALAHCRPTPDNYERFTSSGSTPVYVRFSQLVHILHDISEVDLLEFER